LTVLKMMKTMNCWKSLNYIINHCIYGVPNNGLKRFRKLPSNARIFPKGFRRSHFRTSFLSIFQNFFDSCANSKRKITKLFYEIFM
jgi:hypothetical protein